MGVKHRIGRLALGAVSAFAITLTVAPAASAYTPGASPDFFGINAPFLRQLALPDNAPRLEAVTTSMGQQGISWARVPFDQAVEEHDRGVFNWYVPDTMVTALARHGVRAMATFIGTAWWDANPMLLGTCGSRAYPSDVGGWEDWVGAAARRYGPHGTFWAAHPELPQLPIQRWEIGNEPNLRIFWCPKADPYLYAHVYARSADAIHTADPGARVTVGGLAANFYTPKSRDADPTKFLTGMLAAIPSLRTSIDEVGIHTYSASADGSLALIAQFRQVMNAVGMPATPLLADEFGWYTQGPSGPYLATESQRVDLIAGTANRLWRTDCGLSGMAPYSWATPEANVRDPENWYGLANPWSGEPHPSGLEYGRQIQLALGLGSSPPPTSTVAICPGQNPDPAPAPSPSGPLQTIQNILQPNQ